MEVDAGRSVAISSAAFSPIIMAAALVLPLTTFGMTLASATRRASMPWTRSRGSTLAGREVSIVETTGRFVATAVVTIVYRDVYLGQEPGTVAPTDALCRGSARS